jgi:hypothetical protein
MDRKNVATLRTCCQETKSAKKLVFTSKSPVLAAKIAENGAFLAHPEPEILLIEVAYFSAATEYTYLFIKILFCLTQRCQRQCFDLPVSISQQQRQ